MYSIKELDRSIYAPSARLDDYDIRIYLEPFLFKIKTNNNFHEQISGAFGDVEGIPGGVNPKFIENYPKRCQKLNEIVESFGFDDEIPCDFFIR